MSALENFYLYHFHLEREKRQKKNHLLRVMQICARKVILEFFFQIENLNASSFWSELSKKIYGTLKGGKCNRNRFTQLSLPFRNDSIKIQARISFNPHIGFLSSQWFQNEKYLLKITYVLEAVPKFWRKLLKFVVKLVSTVSLEDFLEVWQVEKKYKKYQKSLIE